MVEEAQVLDESMEMLYGALIRLDNEPENEGLLEWVKNVCQPEYGVVDGLVANFIDYLDDVAYVTRILKILKKVNEQVPQLCLPQLCQNIYFPPALVKYLEQTQLKDLAGDAFILLVNLFDEKSIQSATPEFVQKLIDSIPFIVDENTLHALLSILVCVMPYFEKTMSHNNVILNEFITSEKEDFYKDKLLYLTNRGSMYRLDKCMQTIGVLLSNYKSEKFFNENDIDIIVSVGLRELATPNAARARVQILRVLNQILDHPTYLEFYKQRLADYNSTIESQILHEDESSIYGPKEREQIAIMNIKLMDLLSS